MLHVLFFFGIFSYYTFIKILEIFLPTRLLEPTRLLISEKYIYVVGEKMARNGRKTDI